jgi:hypothetical protein
LRNRRMISMRRWLPKAAVMRARPTSPAPMRRSMFTNGQFANCPFVTGRMRGLTSFHSDPALAGPGWSREESPHRRVIPPDPAVHAATRDRQAVRMLVRRSWSLSPVRRILRGMNFPARASADASGAGRIRDGRRRIR